MRRKIITVIIVCILNICLFVGVVIHLSKTPQPKKESIQDFSPSNNITTNRPNTSGGTATADPNSNQVQSENTTPVNPEKQENNPPSVPDAPQKDTESKPESSIGQTVFPPENNNPEKEEPLPTWKKLYSGYVQVKKAEYDRFALVYIDNDDIPELYMCSNDKAQLCAVRGNATIGLMLNGVGGGNYQKKSGNLMNVYPENGYLVMRIYRLKDVFTQTFYGKEDKTTDPPAYYISNYAGPVSEEEFKEAASEYIDTENLTFLHQNALSYDAFIEQITG